jgi:transposase-like protein
MPRKGYKVEEIINRLREAEILIQQGRTVGEAARKIEVSEYTYYRWRQRCRGIGVD